MSEPGSARRLGEESGSALIAGILILLVITMLGFVAIQYADVQTHQTGRERAGEEAFNFAESTLDAEVSLLGTTWPSTLSTAYPVCNQASTASTTCPQGALSSGYNTTYAGSGFGSPTWSVQVVDDDVTGVADANYYNDSILTSSQLAHYDFNGDNKVWVRASATIQGVTRTVVALVVRQPYTVWLPQNVLTSGGVQTSNNGNKIIIEAKDSSSGLTGTVDLRCGSSTTTPSYGSYCAGWDSKHGQLDPPNSYQAAYTDPITPNQTVTDGTLEALRQSAQSSGTYYPAGQCPPLDTPGVLFIENANCSYSGGGSGSTPWNSDAAPGAIVVANGTLTLDGLNFYGVIYMANGQGTAPASGQPCSTSQQNTVLTVQGGGGLHGGAFIDKCGTTTVGDMGYDITYDTKAFGGLHTYAVPTVALSTFRVIGGG
jgi:Tfp pilus assembly protein PilX